VPDASGVLTGKVRRTGTKMIIETPEKEIGFYRQYGKLKN
jgi:hypothetical protein